MTISSSKGTVKLTKDVRVCDFVLPVHTQAGSGQKEQRRDQAAASPEHAAEWSPASLEVTTFRESAIILENARKDAKELLLKSNRIAEQILKETREQAEQIKAEASDEGYRSGYEKGFKEGVDRAVLDHGRAMETRMEEFDQDLKAALAAVAEAKERCLRTYLEQLKDCSVAVAEKVIHISLKSSGEVIKRMLIAETERLRKTAWVKIYMEKTDYELMLETDADVIGELSRLSDNIKFIVMDKDNSGNCIIEMPDEIIDISVDTQLGNIKEILQNIRV